MASTRTVATPSLGELFDILWRDYVNIAPQAARVHALLVERGETIVNDHIALRTFAVPAVNIDVMARAFTSRGYVPGGEYVFPEKKLLARHYEHPDTSLPKVFISELRLDECSPGLRATVAELLAHVTPDMTARADFVASGRPWPLSYRTYEELLGESEYAAWVAAFGFRANHFTVDVGSLRTFASLQELDHFLMSRGFVLSESGGIIKGTPAELLEQSSTRAGEVEVAFTDRTCLIPSCYYEFARRYPTPGGELFRGFVPGSANRLFESTNARG